MLQAAMSQAGIFGSAEVSGLSVPVRW